MTLIFHRYLTFLACKKVNKISASCFVSLPIVVFNFISFILANSNFKIKTFNFTLKMFPRLSSMQKLVFSVLNRIHIIKLYRLPISTLCNINRKFVDPCNIHFHGFCITNYVIPLSANSGCYITSVPLIIDKLST